MLDNSQVSCLSQQTYFSHNQKTQNQSIYTKSQVEEESSLSSDKEWLSDSISNSLFDQIRESKSNKYDQKYLFNKKSMEHLDFSDSESGSPINMIEGYEMSELLQKFDNISKNNISKNIIKAFFGYLLDTTNNDLLTDFVSKGVQISQARKMAKNYFKSYSFNNNSLHKLIQHPKYGKAFEFYLTFEAEIWLAESKVQQKDTHLVYIDFLKLCCSNPNFSDHIVTYKKNKRSKFNDRI